MSGTLTDTLQIGDLALQIEGPASWIESFQQMWQGWMGDAMVEPWTLSMIMASDAPAGSRRFTSQLRFADGVCHMIAPGFSGAVDPSQAAAHLEAHPEANVRDLSLFVRTCMALQAFDRGGILFHAAGVVRQGLGFALFGLSGSGKTTAARFSRESVVLNDDLVLLMPGKSGWQLWGTPFGGSWLPQAWSAPLRALLHLVKDREDRLEALGPGAALGELAANSPVINAHATEVPVLLTRWQGILDRVPVRALHFRRGPAFWEVVDAEFG